MRIVPDSMTTAWQSPKKFGDSRPVVRATIQKQILNSFPYDTAYEFGSSQDQQRHQTTGTKVPAGSYGVYIHGGLNHAGGAVSISNAAVYPTSLSDANVDANYDTMYESGELASSRQALTWTDNGNGVGVSNNVSWNIPTGTTLANLGIWDPTGKILEGLPNVVSFTSGSTVVYTLGLNVTMDGS